MAIPTAPQSPELPEAPAPTLPVQAAPVEPAPAPVTVPSQQQVSQQTPAQPPQRNQPYSQGQVLTDYNPKVQESIRRLLGHLTNDESSEVILNGPAEVGFKKNGQRYIDNSIDFEDAPTYHSVIDNFLLPYTSTPDRIYEGVYRIQGQMSLPSADPLNPRPYLSRIHIFAPPVVETAKVTIAKKSRNSLTLAGMVDAGSLTLEMAEFLAGLARGRATVVFSGVSGSGKTTLLEAMSKEFDVSDRIILIEDTPELHFAVADMVSLLSKIPRPGEQDAGWDLEWLVSEANRARPDRIIVGEVRGPEMGEFLIAANSGAEGSMTTVHANTPQGAIQKMVTLASKVGTRSEAAIVRDIASTVQIIVQLGRVDGKYKVLQIEEVTTTIAPNASTPATSSIFKYDRTTDSFQYVNRPSDDLILYLQQRGVAVDLKANY